MSPSPLGTAGVTTVAAGLGTFVTATLICMLASSSWLTDYYCGCMSVVAGYAGPSALYQTCCLQGHTCALVREGRKGGDFSAVPFQIERPTAAMH